MPCQKEKLLFIITQGTWGGAQKYTIELGKKLLTKYEVCFAIGENYEELATKLPKETKSYKLKNLVRNICPKKDLKAIKEIRNLVKKLNIDIVHLNSTKAGVLGSLALKKSKAKVIYTAHGWIFNEPLSAHKKKLYTFLEKYTSRYKDVIIVLSQKEKNDAVRIGIQEEKLAVIPLGIEKPTFLSKEDARKQLNLDLKTKIFGTIANFYRTKGLDILIEAAKNHKNLNFAIIGDGMEKKLLESLIKGHKLKNIKLLGKKDEASKYLKAFDAFILPSRKEGFPYVLLEAMAAGLPIIATKVGGIEEMLSKYENKILVEKENPKELSEAIGKIDTKKASTEAFPYPIEEMTKKTIKVYTK